MFKRLNTWPGTQGFNSFFNSGDKFLFAGLAAAHSSVLTGCQNNDSLHGLIGVSDANGNLIWTHCYDGDADFLFTAFASDGSIWVAGGFDTVYGTQTSVPDTIGNQQGIIKFDSLGNPLWYRYYGSSNSSISDFIATSDAGALLLEYFNYPGSDIPYKYGNNPFNYNAWLCKVDSTGHIRWSLVLGGSGDDQPEKVRETEPGIYTVLINTLSTDYMLSGINFDTTTASAWILTIDSNGNIISSKVTSSTRDSPLYTDFARLGPNSIALTGYEYITPQLPYPYCQPGFTGSYDFIVVGTDTNGNYDDCILSGGTRDDFLYYTCKLNDSIIVAAGYSNSIDHDMSHCSGYSTGNYHGWLGLYNMNQRKMVWEQAFCGSGEDEIQGLLYDSTQNAVYALITGNSTDGDFAGLALDSSSNMYLLKYTPVTTAINEVNNNAPEINVFPNPTAEYINITCANLLSGYRYYFTVYDLLGQPVSNMPLALASTTLPCANWSPGVYIWEVRDESGNMLTEGKVVKE